MAPLIQLAYRAALNDECSVTDSIGVVLEPRRPRLSLWNRQTIDLVRARCRGEMAKALQLLKQRYIAYPKSNVAPTHYALSLQFSNQPRAARGDSAPDGSRARPGLVEFARRGLASVLVANGRDLAHGGWISGRGWTSPIAGAIQQTRSGRWCGDVRSVPSVASAR